MNDDAVNLEDELLVDFLDEASQLLDRLNENLLTLDEWAAENADTPAARIDEDLLNDMFRAAHSIKGLSGMLGFSCINALIHKVENLFDAARKEQLTVDPPCVEVLFGSIDLVTAMVHRLRTEGTDVMPDNGVADQIKQLLQASGCEREATTQRDAEQALAAELAQISAEVSQAIHSVPDDTLTAAPGIHPMPAATGTPSDAAGQPANAAARLEDFRIQFEKTTDETEVPAKYLAIFIDETEMSLDTLSEALLSEDAASSAQAVESTLIVAHRIKGAAASVGLNRPARLAHLMEDILQELRESNARLWPELIDVMLRCGDALRHYNGGLKSGNPDWAAFPQCAYELISVERTSAQAPNANGVESAPRSATSMACEPSQGASSSSQEAPPGNGGNPSASATPASSQGGAGRDRLLPLDAAAVNSLLEMVATGHSLIVGHIDLEPGLPLAGLKGQLLVEKLAARGELLHVGPRSEGIDQLEELNRIVFALSTKVTLDELRPRLNIAGVRHLELSLHSPENQHQAIPSPSEDEARPSASPSHPSVSSPPPAGDASAPIEAATKPMAEASPQVAANSNREAAPAISRGRPSEPVQKAAETLRVDIERLDQLMNLAGQLVINKARFSQIGEGLKHSLPIKQTSQVLANAVTMVGHMLNAVSGDDQRSGRLDVETIRSQARRLKSDLDIALREVNQLTQVRTSVNELFEAVHQLDRVTDGIQKTVMDTRMVPIGPLFTRFKRVIRDITRTNGKQIQLVINGEKTELDKRMIDELGDPLIHMVRNSADHGIESPEERQAAGKSPQGTVTLDACHRGNSIVIQVRDDGKGLDPDRILAKAIQRKLISPTDAERMSNSQIYQLIWEPGFSTAEKVTEISGRGMGMDIVRSKIEELNGQVEVDSTLGQGTVFRIKLPLTLAILPSLMAEIDGDVFALPVESIVEIVSVRRQEFATVHGKNTACVRGRVVSVVQLNEIFTWHTPPVPSSRPAGNEQTLVILGLDGREIGLAVDGLLGEEDIVIKSLAENYQNISGIAGASILGNGRVSLILDPSTLIEMASRADSGRSAAWENSVK